MTQKDSAMQLVLKDDKIIQCVLTNRRGAAMKIPRNNILKYLNSLPETGSDTCRGKVCLYILLGADQENKMKKQAYIGQTTNIMARVRDHDLKRDLWNEIIVFYFTADVLDIGTARYVEGELIETANEVKRYSKIFNGQKTCNVQISEHQRLTAEEFLGSVKIIANVLGYNLFEAVGETEHHSKETPKSDLPSPTFTLKYKNIEARGQLSAGGFVVFAGSKIDPDETNSCPPATKFWRSSLSEDKIIVENCFAKNYEFSSASAAASFVKGGSAGRNDWKLSDGTAMNDYLNAEANKIVANMGDNADSGEEAEDEAVV